MNFTMNITIEANPGAEWIRSATIAPKLHDDELLRQCISEISALLRDAPDSCNIDLVTDLDDDDDAQRACRLVKRIEQQLQLDDELKNVHFSHANGGRIVFSRHGALRRAVMQTLQQQVAECIFTTQGFGHNVLPEVIIYSKHNIAARFDSGFGDRRFGFTLTSLDVSDAGWMEMMEKMMIQRRVMPSTLLFVRGYIIPSHLPSQRKEPTNALLVVQYWTPIREDNEHQNFVVSTRKFDWATGFGRSDVIPAASERVVADGYDLGLLRAYGVEIDLETYECKYYPDKIF